ncbi:MAG: tetratricopeptide repeat protein, partial [Planctomycetes bacterium]|nr:tetratricopeptide repeat protein [Planctomycetota bacterium]
LVAKLGDLYLHRKRYEDAAKTYKRAQELAPTSFAIRQKIGDLQFKRIELFIDQLEQKAAGSPNDETLKKQLAEALQKQKKFAVKEYGERLALHPTDLGLHFKLGQALFDNDEMDKAITEFQQSIADPKIRFQSRHLLGQCFARKKQYDLAIRQFQGALEGASSITDSNKPVFYELALAYLGQGNKQLSLETFKKIYEVDINFRDVSAKIAELEGDKSS